MAEAFELGDEAVSSGVRGLGLLQGDVLAPLDRVVARQRQHAGRGLARFEPDRAAERGLDRETLLGGRAAHLALALGEGARALADADLQLRLLIPVAGEQHADLGAAALLRELHGRLDRVHHDF